MRWVASPSVLKGVKVKSKSNLIDLSYALFLAFSLHHVSLLFTILFIDSKDKSVIDDERHNLAALIFVIYRGE